MRTLTTDRFGTLTFEEELLIEFPFGLPAFEEETQFLLVQREALHPLVFLQSAKAPNLCFTMVPIEFVDPGYHLRIGVADRKALGWNEEGGEHTDTGVLCFGILCANDGTAPTVNLLGPVVIDQKRRVGVQAVREDALYSAQHELFPAGQGDAQCL